MPMENQSYGDKNLTFVKWVMSLDNVKVLYQKLSLDWT